MSHSIDKIKQHRSKRVNKSGESTSNTNAQSQTEGDSRLHRSQCITNTPIVAGTFTLLIASLFLPAIVGIDAYADDSITVTLSGNPTITVAPTTEGTFADSGDITIGVTSSSSSGYTLSITGTDNTSLVGKTDNTKSITSIPTGSALSAEAFNTSTYNNMWGYKPSMYYNTSTEQRSSNSSYLPSPGSSGDIIDITDDSSSNDYTMSIGARVTNTLGFQTYENNTFVIAAVGNTSDVDCDPTKLCIHYDANGGYFGDNASKTVNSVVYDAVYKKTTITKILHSDNVGDDGIATGNSAVNTSQTKEATIDGAGNVSVTLYYDTEGVSYDWVTLYAGADSIPSNTNDTNKGSNGNLTGKLGGNKSGYTTSYTTWNVWNNDGNPIDSDTVKIHFRTDGAAGSYISYGYYAIVTGESAGYSKTVASGAYATPDNDGNLVSGFLGWSTDKNATTPTYTTETEISSNLQTINGDAAVTLYAIWKTVSASTCTTPITVSGSTITYMQDIASSNKDVVKNAMTEDAQYVLKDKRDERFYCVSKLRDGNIWMTQNLDLDLDDTKTLTREDTDLGWSTDTATQTWTPKHSTIDATGGTISNWTNDDNEPYSVDPGDWYWMGNPFYASATCNYLTGCTTNFAKAASDGTNGSHGHVGNYYNWSAAVASNSTSSYTSSTISNIANNPQNSICPAGWRLPTIYGGETTDDAKNEFYTLNKLYNSGVTDTTQKLLDSPLFFIRGGEVYGGSLGSAGFSASYWSSTVYDSHGAYNLIVVGNMTPAGILNRTYGFSVRCLVR